MQRLATRSSNMVLANRCLAARCARTLLPATLLLLGLLAPLHAKEQEIHPVYVGSKTCVSCHQGETMGQQFTKWFQSAHAKAYASLAKPEAHQIAALSGIPLDPQKSATCLGCHTTGARQKIGKRIRRFTYRMEYSARSATAPAVNTPMSRR